MKKARFLKIFIIVGIIAIIIGFVLAILATIGAVDLGDRCFRRYGVSNNSSGANSVEAVDSTTATVILRADGNYLLSTTSENNSSASISNNYGQWLNTGITVFAGDKVEMKIRGAISLCRAYLPKYNLQSDNNLDVDNKPIVIPRIEENAPPVSLVFDAKTEGWRNIAQLYPGDKIVISLAPDRTGKSSVNLIDVFDKKNIFSADCSENKSDYSPLCGRYSIYKGVSYISSCQMSTDYSKIGQKISFSIEHEENRTKAQEDFVNASVITDDSTGFHTSYNVNELKRLWNIPENVYYPPGSGHSDNRKNETGSCGLYRKKLVLCNCSHSQVNKQKRCTEFTINDEGSYWGCSCEKEEELCECRPFLDLTYNTGPAPYRDNQSETFDWSDNLAALTNARASCSSNATYTKQDFWFSASRSGGLVYRFDDYENIANPKNLGTNYKFASISDDQETYNDKEKLIIHQQPYVGSSLRKYLQYSFLSRNDNFANNTGGYVVQIKQTACYREYGASIDDINWKARGRIDYIIVPFSENPQDPSVIASKTPIPITINDSEGGASINVGSQDGYLLMRINNRPEDYKESYGQYFIDFIKREVYTNSGMTIISNMLTKLTDMIKDTSKKIFSNMVCYKKTVTSSCTNFFTYINLFLTIYLITYIIRYMLGMINITSEELVIVSFKIALVAGLVNGTTFEFFNTVVFDFMFNFSNQLIANMSGYSFFSDTGSIKNPFMFMDALISRVFFSKTFLVQLLALLAMGISGIFYFIIVVAALGIALISVFRAIAVYCMATLALAALVTVAPLIISLMLFTNYFNNMLRFAVRYMIEPFILFAGIIILTQLFTIYLDLALNYSVCWKCVFPIKIPFIGLSGFPENLVNIPLFCIYWFFPWGLDSGMSMLGINMQHIVALLIIAYCMYGYISLVDQIVMQISNSLSPSATSAGSKMASAAEDKVLHSVGLDAQSRREIMGKAKARRDEMIKHAFSQKNENKNINNQVNKREINANGQETNERSEGANANGNGQETNERSEGANGNGNGSDNK